MSLYNINETLKVKERYYKENQNNGILRLLNDLTNCTHYDELDFKIVLTHVSKSK